MRQRDSLGLLFIFESKDLYFMYEATLKNGVPIAKQAKFNATFHGSQIDLFTSSLL